MTFKYGEIVSNEDLQNLFSKSVVEYNGLDYTQIASLTSGQVRYTGTKDGDYFNVYSDQCYDVDSDMKIFNYLEDRISKIEGRT